MSTRFRLKLDQLYKIMSSQVVKESQERGHERAAERNRGINVSGGLRFSSARTAEALIHSAARLPNVVTTRPLQNPDGTFLQLEGYDS